MKKNKQEEEFGDEEFDEGVVPELPKPKASKILSEEDEINLLKQKLLILETKKSEMNFLETAPLRIEDLEARIDHGILN